MNKKGNVMVVMSFILILFFVLILGFMAIVGSSLANWTMDEIIPELTNLGMVGDANMTQIADPILNSVNTVVQNFTWLTGVLYVMLLVASLGFAIGFRTSPRRWLMGLYFCVALILLLGAIYMSNIYEDISTDGSELALIMQEHTILNFMILYSPAIFTAIIFLTGIILFSGAQEGEFI